MFNVFMKKIFGVIRNQLIIDLRVRQYFLDFNQGPAGNVHPPLVAESIE
jgi:hypothetical protein